MIWANHDHEKVSKRRQYFLNSNQVDTYNTDRDDVRQIIEASWQISKNAGIDPHANKVSLPNNTKIILNENEMQQRIPQLHKYARDLQKDLLDDFYSYLDKIDAVLFYIESDLTIFIQRGNAKTLQHLNSLSIGVGTNLQEQYVGTNAAALLKRVNSNEAWVVGAEHYLDVLQPYATYVFDGSEKYANYYTMILLPKDSFTDHFIEMMHIFLKTRTAIIALHRKTTELNIQSRLYSNWVAGQDKAIIFVDFAGKIINVNNILLNWFDLRKESVVEHELSIVFPELIECLECMQRNKTITLQDISFKNNNGKVHTFKVSCECVEDHTAYKGLVITLLNDTSVRKLRNQISNAQSFYTFDSLIGNSPTFTAVKNIAQKIANGNSTILLTGESGTGKELFAHAIHSASPRKDKPFVATNCSVFPAELVGSELFGYVEGAFTGARRNGSMGKFEYAHEGTIFLDEIGDLPMEVQTAFLRVLDERRITRVGSNTSTPINIRIISATNKDLMKLVQEGRFRLDLYYRLNIVNIELPPLRERKEDITELAYHFLEHFKNSLEKNIFAIEAKALEALINYEWPGNIRQLRNVIERGINIAQGESLKYEDISRDLNPVHSRGPQSTIRNNSIIENKNLAEYEIFEKNLILDLLQKHKGNKCLVAKELGISRGKLYKRLDKYHL